MAFDPVALGHKISSRRAELGLTQRELSIRCCVSQVSVHLWEKGNNPPSLARLALLADVLGTTMAELLADDDDANGGDKAVA